MKGSDTNDGASETSAFKTLSAAMAHTVSGETVIALPGIYSYADGTVVSPGGTLPAVVTVSNGVTLVSRDGAATTVIEGRVADTFWTDSDSNKARGLGADNVRCVFLQPNAVLDGFTIRHGGVFDGTSVSVNTCGGGIYANTTSTEPDQVIPPQATVRNCRIELCAGATRCGVYEYCTIISNINQAADAGSLLSHAQSLYGCVIAYNRGENAIDSPRQVVGCTFCDNTLLNGWQLGKSINSDPYYATRKFVNCLFHESPELGTPISTNKVKHAYNCIVPREGYFCSTSSKEAHPNSDYGNPVYENITVASADLDGDFRPVDLSGAAIDAVTNSYATFTPLMTPGVDTAKDLTGGQRVYNGVQDIGAVEADWRARYAADIGVRRLTVTAASPETVENVDGKVEIREGELALVWRNPRSMDAPQATMSFEVKGDGTLTLQIGETTRTYTKADGAVTYPLALPAQSTKEITFTYTPVGGDTQGAQIGPFVCPFGTILLLK